MELAKLTFRRPAEPVFEKDISDLESFLGFTFPKDYRDFLLKINGGYQPSLEIFDIGNGEGTFLKHLYSVGGEKPDLRSRIEYKLDEIPLDLVPIGADGFGNDICLGVSGERRGEVYFHYHDREKIDPEDEFDPVYFVAHDFADFLKSLRMDPGKIIHDEIELMGKNGGRADLLNFISKGNSLEKTNRYNRTVTQEAARYGNIKLVEIGHEHGASLKGCLHMAVVNGHLKVIDYLLNAGVDVNERDKDGKTALTRCAWRYKKEIGDFLKKRGGIE